MRRGGENDGSATLTYFRRSKKREEEIERCTSQLPLFWYVVHTGYAAKEKDGGSSLKLISSQIFPCIHLGEGGESSKAFSLLVSSRRLWIRPVWTRV